VPVKINTFTEPVLRISEYAVSNSGQKVPVKINTFADTVMKPTDAHHCIKVS
jgi:hypothetical protein